MEAFVKIFAFFSILLIAVVLFPELAGAFEGYSGNIFPGFWILAFFVFIISAAWSIKNSDI